ncbi:class I SAM-dependent methyltransferase [Chitinophaga sp.]|uniref:class I SAM-dependent methyltransferase n=1 Tax=Chitinophaga sp. TaxID=1869181 RepID=UPI0031DF5474
MKAVPDNTAVRVALWRALHLQVDAPPHILEDDLGLQLVAPESNWQARGDMHPEGTKQARLSIVTRARFTEDLVRSSGTQQYVILGAGLDTFALRHNGYIAVYEIDQPLTQEWKKQRIQELGWTIPDFLHFVPVDFEKDSDWLKSLTQEGFDRSQPAVISCTGVSMYLTHDAITGLLQKVAALARGTTLSMTFLLPAAHLHPDEQRLLEMAMKGAAAAGTPFLSFFTPEQMLDLAQQAGFKYAEVITGDDLTKKYFQGRKDGLSLSNSELILVANT